MVQPWRLRVEHVDDALGIDQRRPRLSWRLPPNARQQVAYRIRAGVWDSGRVESARSVLVPFMGPALTSGERVTWRVKVWTDAGASDWSDPCTWEMGLLGADDWIARWVEPDEPDAVRSSVLHPAYLLRGGFVLSSPVERARLYATAHGIYEFFVNGRRVGDQELTPGFTSYRSTLQVQTFDVTALLQPGENVLGAVLSDGWFRGQTTGLRQVRAFGDSVALLAQLNVTSSGGAVLRRGTGPDWVSAVGPIRSADLIEGQTVDLRAEPTGWERPGRWTPVVVRDYDLSRLRSSPAPPVRRVSELRPLTVSHPAPGRQVVDLGQNVNGWVRLSGLGPAGTTVTLTHAEALGTDGDVTLGALVPDLDLIPAAGDWPRDPTIVHRALQVDQVTSAGERASIFEPRHTTHGFRYVGVQGHPDELRVDDAVGVVVHSDLRRTGWFECDDDRINRLHEAAVWTFRGNACDIPTDCPTRERAGWTGDWQTFVASAAFLYDVAGFSAKWLRDLAADQQADGTVQHFTPNTMPSDLESNPFPPGAAGWGDAAVIVPWEVYRAYGDVQVLEDAWASMTAWVDRAARIAREGRHPDRVAVRPVPATHERYLWDTGFHWGEWLQPGEQEFDPAVLAAADHAPLATAYLHHSARLLAACAEVLGKAEEAVRYASLASSVRDAWQAEFLGPDGALVPDTQAAHVRALAFGLVASSSRPAVAQRLVHLVRAAGTHLDTGFLATPLLLPVLADAGHAGLAYELLFQDRHPSWMTMIDRGATTIWEDWDGIDEHGVARYSLNHYSKGSVVGFLHRHVAGIQLTDEPAYRRFRIAPTPGVSLTWARAVHESAYGRIESAWQLDGDVFTLEVTVPPGTNAEIVLPDGTRHEDGPGDALHRCTVVR